ncbi:MAG TPA: hypothetical protein VKG45_11775 [Actinomycetes bacterium]|nr:hypothetical protein [Actinomycetes bacterium]
MNDWMQEEVRRQAYEAGDPTAQTGSWALPAPRGGGERSLLGWTVLVLGVAVALAAALASLMS